MTYYAYLAAWVAFAVFVAYLLWLGPAPREPGADKRYRVTWTADLDASSAQEAAYLASEVLDQPGHTATRFSVLDRRTGAVTAFDTSPDDGPRGENPVCAPGGPVASPATVAAAGLVC